MNGILTSVNPTVAHMCLEADYLFDRPMADRRSLQESGLAVNGAEIAHFKSSN